MKVKQIGVLSLSGILLFAIFQSAIASVQVPIFSDVPGSNPNFEAINFLKTAGIIQGYPDGTFKPDQTVNRVEALKIILLGANIDVPEISSVKLTFKDINAGQWYIKYLSKAIELKIVQGYADGTFKPTQTVNLAENLKMLINTKGIDTSKITVSSNPYVDAIATEWYAKFVQYAKDQNWLKADGKNMIYPSQGITRGKLAQLIYNAKNTPIIQTQQQTQQVTQQNWQTDYTLNVNIEGFAFKKDSMTIGVGTTVKWTNNDTADHQVIADGGQFSSPTLKQGDTWNYTFNEKGTFNYHCSLHPTMKGSIIVKPANEVPTI
jgi:plastocyanin/predicted DNA-binding antitoxin AbrB/MazE fold protein